jgi:hypothetical protein
MWSKHLKKLKCTEILQFKMLNLCTSSCIYWMSFQYWRKVVLKLDFDSASARNQQSTIWHCPDSKTTSLCFYSLMAHRQSLTWLFWDKSYDLILHLRYVGQTLCHRGGFFWIRWLIYTFSIIIFYLHIKLSSDLICPRFKCL